MVVVSGLVELRRPSEWLGAGKRSEEDSLWSFSPNERIQLGSRWIPSQSPDRASELVCSNP